jgi:CheY-like chemotaxis protein
MQNLPIKVLIADDKANIRNLLSEGLSAKVEHVTEVSGGPEALAPCDASPEERTPFSAL